jgi:hypothetical protein
MGIKVEKIKFGNKKSRKSETSKQSLDEISETLPPRVMTT